MFNTLNNLNYIDTYNAIVGAIVTFLTCVFGAHWYLFVLFLGLNIARYLDNWLDEI